MDQPLSKKREGSFCFFFREFYPMSSIFCSDSCTDLLSVLSSVRISTELASIQPRLYETCSGQSVIHVSLSCIRSCRTPVFLPVVSMDAGHTPNSLLSGISFAGEENQHRLFRQSVDLLGRSAQSDCTWISRTVQKKQHRSIPAGWLCLRAGSVDVHYQTHV